MTTQRDRPATRIECMLLPLLAIACLASPGRGEDRPAGYLDIIRAQADALREGDAPPTTLAEWQPRREAIRKGLVAAWGGFPAEACPLEPRVLGTFERDGYRVEKVVFQTRRGVWMTANAYVPDAPGKHPAILAVHG